MIYRNLLKFNLLYFYSVIFIYSTIVLQNLIYTIFVEFFYGIQLKIMKLPQCVAFYKFLSNVHMHMFNVHLCRLDNSTSVVYIVIYTTLVEFTLKSSTKSDITRKPI